MDEPEPKELDGDIAEPVAAAEELREPPDTTWVEMEQIRGVDWPDVFGGEMR